MTTTLITGNTYPVKDQIRALGGRWNRAAQGWDVPSELAEQARAIVASAGPAAPRRPMPTPKRGGYGRYRRYGAVSVNSLDYRDEADCPQYTGREFYQNARGRCEDAPCCGCCS